MGGGSVPSKTTQIVKSEIPEWAKPYYSSIGRRGMRASQGGYQRYGGDRLAPFTGAEQQAFRGTQALYSGGPREELGYAMGQTQQAGITGANPGQWGSQAYNQYMNPYVQNVLDVQKDRIMKDYGQMMNRSGRDIASGAAAQGTRGGRASLMGARAAGEISDAAMQNLRELESSGWASAYESAQQAFDRDRAAAQAGAGIQLQAADQARALAQMQQDQAIQRIGTLQKAGLSQREMNQSVRDLAYQDFIEKKNWDKEQLNWFAGLLSGTPYATVDRATMATQMQPGASPISQVAGLGLAGLGAYQSGMFS